MEREDERWRVRARIAEHGVWRGGEVARYPRLLAGWWRGKRGRPADRVTARQREPRENHALSNGRETWRRGKPRYLERTFEGRAVAKYGLPHGEITTAPRLAARSILRPRPPPALFYTFHRTNLIIRSVFAAYFDCEILHLAFV